MFASQKEMDPNTAKVEYIFVHLQTTHNSDIPEQIRVFEQVGWVNESKTHVRIYRFSPHSLHSTIYLIMLIFQNCLIIIKKKKVNSYVVCGQFGMITSWANGHQL